MLSIFHQRLVLEKWQGFVTRPDPHESGKWNEGGKMRVLIRQVKTLCGGEHQEAEPAEGGGKRRGGGGG